MTLEEIKTLEHVVVSVDAVGMVKIEAEDGYLLVHTEEIDVPVIDENGEEPSEAKLTTNYVKAVYCREGCVLPDYYVEKKVD